MESCSDNFPIRNYTLLVEGVVGPTVAATPTDSVVTTTVSTEDLAILVPDQMFQVGVQVCSDVTCRDSLVTVVLSKYRIYSIRRGGLLLIYRPGL